MEEGQESRSSGLRRAASSHTHLSNSAAPALPNRDLADTLADQLPVCPLSGYILPPRAGTCPYTRRVTLRLVTPSPVLRSCVAHRNQKAYCLMLLYAAAASALSLACAASRLHQAHARGAAAAMRAEPREPFFAQQPQQQQWRLRSNKDPRQARVGGGGTHGNGYTAARLFDAAAAAVAAAGLVTTVTALCDHAPLLLRNLTALERRRQLDKALPGGGPELPSATDVQIPPDGRAWQRSIAKSGNRNACTRQLPPHSNTTRTH